MFQVVCKHFFLIVYNIAKRKSSKSYFHVICAKKITIQITLITLLTHCDIHYIFSIIYEMCLLILNGIIAKIGYVKSIIILKKLTNIYIYIFKKQFVNTFVRIYIIHELCMIT